MIMIIKWNFFLENILQFIISKLINIIRFDIEMNFIFLEPSRDATIHTTSLENETQNY